MGIGGSNLGSQAVYQALFGRECYVQYPLYFADTVDADLIARLLELMRTLLDNKKRVLVCVITKSGTTTETIANYECFLSVLQHYYPERWQDFVVAITDENSKLWHLALKEKISVLAVPALVGGRYSVLSAVGLFPLACAGIDIEKFFAGAREAVQNCLGEDIMTNPAAHSATIIAHFYKKGIAIHDLFLFSVDLEGIGKWYRQLMGESIGKEFDIHGNKKYIGITPTVSLGSTDLHSVGQLYLGGPKDKLTTMVQVKKLNRTVTVPHMQAYESLVPHIQGKQLQTIMEAIIVGVQRAYQKADRPFMMVTLPEKNAFYIGQFLQCKMIEMMYIGALLEVNPFDQPQVELYKQETREILAYE